MEPKPSRARLMILDNDLGLVELAAWYLERQGYVVDKATSFREARHLLLSDPPDLLLSDVEMGEESGAEELPRLSSQGILPPTLVVSGFLDAELAERLGGLPGVLGTLLKPFDLPVLEQRIEACLARVAAGDFVPARRLDASLAAPAVTEDEDGWIEVRGPRHPAPFTPPTPPTRSGSSTPTGPSPWHG
jgi:DNA-binding response OmpR family regulator